MRVYLVLVFSFGVLVGCAAAPTAGDGPDPAAPLKFTDSPIVEQTKSCFSGRFSTYDEWMQWVAEKYKNSPGFSLERYEQRFPRDRYEAVKKKLDCFVYDYKVDEITVKGFVVIPKQIGNKKLPVIIYNRGGNATYGSIGFSHIFDKMFPLAEHGFIVIASQYRGGTKWKPEDNINGGADEFGGKDVDDVLALLDIIDAMPAADAGRLGIMGGSRGAMMTYLAAKRSPRFKAAAAISGFSDLKAELIFRPEPEKAVLEKRIPDYRANKEAALKVRSVIYWLDELDPNMPILLLHGTGDKKVSTQSSLRMATELQKRERPYKLVVYKDGDHGLGAYRNEVSAEIIDWFKTHLIDVPAANPPGESDATDE